MSRIRSKGMLPEMIVRRLIHAMGYRYRLHQKNLPGNPDLVFSRRRKIIFVHGCFWHQHPGCTDGHFPASNRGYWIPKLERNIRRDQVAVEKLKELGWVVLIVWECETQDRDILSLRLSEFLSATAPTRK